MDSLLFQQPEALEGRGQDNQPFLRSCHCKPLSWFLVPGVLPGSLAIAHCLNLDLIYQNKAPGFVDAAMGKNPRYVPRPLNRQVRSTARMNRQPGESNVGKMFHRR